MDSLRFNKNASASIHYFTSLQQCAQDTVTYLIQGNIALSGGSTYAALFHHWRDLSPDLSKASFFPVDERIVPFDNPQSNWGTAHKEFLQPLGKESDKNHFAASPDAYTNILTRHFKTEDIKFDTIFLGVGNDGHTASLFPSGSYFDDNSSLVLETRSPKPPFNRITLAPEVLSSARNLITIIAGENKKIIVRELLAQNKKLPIVKILSQRTDSELFIERNLIN